MTPTLVELLVPCGLGLGAPSGLDVSQALGTTEARQTCTPSGHCGLVPGAVAVGELSGAEPGQGKHLRRLRDLRKVG